MAKKGEQPVSIIKKLIKTLPRPNPRHRSSQLFMAALDQQSRWKQSQLLIRHGSDWRSLSAIDPPVPLQGVLTEQTLKERIMKLILLTVGHSGHRWQRGREAMAACADFPSNAAMAAAIGRRKTWR
jgi:hypothetical protein